MKRWFQVIALTAACSVYGQGSFEGAYPAITNYTSSASAVLGTAGWAFEADYGFDITHLGVFNSVLSDASPSAIVHLWDANSNVLASATVNLGSTATNGGYFALIQPVAVGPGTTYYVGAYTSPLGIGVDVAVNRDAFFTGPGIRYIGAAESTNTAGIGMPGLRAGYENVLYAGPNFIYYVPEPSSFALLGLGTLALLLRRRN